MTAAKNKRPEGRLFLDIYCTYPRQFAGRYLSARSPPVHDHSMAPEGTTAVLVNAATESEGVIMMVPPPAAAVYVMVITPALLTATLVTLGVA
jgi:hypothetical protein